MKKVKKPQIIKPLLTYDGEIIPSFKISDPTGRYIKLSAPETKDLFEQLRIIYICERAKNSVEVKKIEREKGIVTAKKTKKTAADLTITDADDAYRHGLALLKDGRNGKM